jgi:hypothetical protein
MRAHPEQTLHRSVAVLLNAALPPEVFFTSVPAGGGGKVRGAILKGLGYRSGTPDILLISNGLAYFIELKVPRTGILSAAQRETIPALQNAGARVRVCRSIEDVENALLDWRIPTRIARSA